jgi:predicted AlkP superfamily phosphohydrolase/phosphomutase
MKKRKVMVVGLDGATFDLIMPWIKAGDLPNLSRLLAEGSYGELESVIPPLTTPAWTSFMTGNNPGKHGIFDFAERTEGSYDIRWVTALSRHGRSLWKIINSHGRKVGVVNIPNNYPLEPIDGFMVAWMDAPGKNDFTYPRELMAEIQREIGDYIITILDWKENESPAALRANLHKMIDKRAELTLYLMNNKPWEFFAVLFTATDIVQHCFWSYMDPLHPLHNPDEFHEYGGVIKEIYVHIDRVLGQIQKNLDSNTSLVVMSDHGAGPLRSVVNLNKWLEQEGFLKFRAGSADNVWSLKSISMKIVQWALSFLKKNLSQDLRSRLKKIVPGLRDRLEGVLMSALFDWQNTRAYSFGSYGNIYINLKNREPEGVVDEKDYEALRSRICTRLMALEDPMTGEKVVKRVYRREELFAGPFLSKAPDLIAHWGDAGYHSVQRFGKKENSIFSNDLRFHLTDLAFSGCHRLNGLFAIKGEGVESGKEIKGARIIDLAPTILYLLGLPLVSEMDGRVLEDAVSRRYLDANPICYEEISLDKEEVGEVKEDVYDEEESKRVAERLRGLGYIE